MDLLYESLKEAAKDVRLNEPMNRHTTFQVGGPADYFAVPRSEEELWDLIKVCREGGAPFFILGNGSNLLVSDEGYRGVMIHIGSAMSSVRREGRFISAEAGISLSRLAQKALEEGLSGLEFASGIPGTAGGALVMNAGAYGGEMSRAVRSARVITKDGEYKELAAKELEMGYRKSCILSRGYAVTGIVCELTEKDRDEIRDLMNELSKRRREKQPLEYPSAGSMFKRPEGYYAGKLIMDAGLAGKRKGGACVSEKHCGFIINKGGATASDIMELCRFVQDEVWKKFGVHLEPEVKLLGFGSDTVA